MDSLTPVYVADRFAHTYSQLLQDSDLDSLRNVEGNSGTEELADALTLIIRH